MTPTHSLTLEQIQLMPTKVWLRRKKPHHWLSVESLFASAHRNHPRIGDTMTVKGAVYKLIDAKLIRVDCAKLEFGLTGPELSPHYIVCFVTNEAAR